MLKALFAITLGICALWLLAAAACDAGPGKCGMPILPVVALAAVAILGIDGVFDKHINSATPASKYKEALYFAILFIFVGLLWLYIKSTF